MRRSQQQRLMSWSKWLVPIRMARLCSTHSRTWSVGRYQKTSCTHRGPLSSPALGPKEMGLAHVHANGHTTPTPPGNTAAVLLESRPSQAERAHNSEERRLG